MNNYEDTIIALATPAGYGAISVIRLSGKDSIHTVNNYFVGKRPLYEVQSHSVHYGKLVTPNSEVIDDVLVTVFRAPNSYTGEDSVEISIHGNPLITTKVIELFMHAGIRNAEPGEFTRRAYLNGRIDLAQAEAVAELISARSDTSLRGARNQLDGLLSQKVTQLRDSLIKTSSLVELELDFAEEDIEFVDRTSLVSMINDILTELESLIASYSFGKTVREGINVALVGAPNVGKSSLLNYFLKEYRAIVSDIPGTTRDVLREELTIDGILYKLYDTAGIRDTDDVIETEGVKRSKETVINSDLVVFLNDATEQFNTELYAELCSLTPQERIISVFNKCDKTENRTSDNIYISAKTGEGINTLFQVLREKMLGVNTYTEKTAIVTNARHHVALTKARENLTNSLLAIGNNFTGEYIATDLRAASESLAEIIGEVSSDDVLNSIFSSFCIGK